MFKNFGVLLCMSSGGCLTLDSLKRYILALSKMGYNTLELVLDDTIKIESEPFYGYLMGGYTVEEMKELDDYAFDHGVNIIPSIQTLGHLDRLVKVPYYEDILDIANIIQADNEKTYQLVEKMFVFLKSAFRSKLVSIGMDEANLVGRGNYLNKHGYVDKYEILFRHLSRVVDIANKYDLKCMMWHDLFISLKYGTGHVSTKNPEIDKRIIDSIPNDLTINYWEYFSRDHELYDSMFSCLKSFNRDLWYTSTVFTCRGFAPHFNLCLKSNKIALESCKKNNIENYIVSLWSDNNNDCSYFTALAALYTIRQYSLNNFDHDSIASGFEDIFGVDYDSFMALQLPNISPNNPDIDKVHCNTKVAMFNDPLLGLRDNIYEKEGKPDYISIANKLREIGKSMKEYSYLYDKEASLCEVLDIKYDLGIRLRKAYQDNDVESLRLLVDDIAECIKRVESFRKDFRKEWYKEFKSHGWDIQEYRLGGLLGRLKGTKESVEDYLDGNLKEIEELKETLLDFGNYFSEFGDFSQTISLRNL